MSRTEKEGDLSDQIKILQERLNRLEASQRKERVDVLVELAWEQGFEHIDEALRINAEAVRLSEELGYEHGIALTDRNLGFYYYAKSNFIEAVQHTNRALETFRRETDKDEEANCLMILGLLYWSLGNFDLSLEYLNESERLFKKMKNTRRLPWVLTTLGGVYESLRDFEKCLLYHKESLEYFRKGGDKLGEARALIGIGIVYQSEGKYQEAIECGERGLDLFTKLKNTMGQSRAFNDIGMAYQGLGQLEQALEFHKRSLALREKLNKHVEVTSLLNLGRAHNLMKQPEKALPFLVKGLKYAEEVAAKPKIYQLHGVLSEAYELSGDFMAALQHARAYQQVRDEVFSNESNTKLRNLEIQFQVEKSEKEAEIHRLRNIELKKALDDLQAAQGQLVQREKLASLGQLTAGIAHEINSPIGVVKSAADVSIRGLAKIENHVRQLAKAGTAEFDELFMRTLTILERNSRTTLSAVERIAKIVQSLKNFARLDEAEYKRVNLHEGIESALTLLQHLISPGIEVVRDFGVLPQVTVYPNQLNQVFMTILQNSIQAVEGHGRIVITTAAGSQHVSISVQDDGKGMSREVIESLFDLSFSPKRARVGVGMGLYNAHNVIKQHNGEIKVNSEPGGGAEFIVTLPIR